MMDLDTKNLDFRLNSHPPYSSLTRYLEMRYLICDVSLPPICLYTPNDVYTLED